jgi:uncharacterized caspase-like protein
MGLGIKSINDESIEGIPYLLMIGVDDYMHLSKLNCSAKDVQDLANILIEKYQFEQENTHILLNSEATRKNIIEAFRLIISKLGKHDSLLIYYSGHGNQIDDKNFWVPYEGTNDVSTHIDNDTILSFIRAMKTKHVVLISDSAFADKFILQQTR